MKPATIVKDLDIPEDGCLRLLAGLVVLVIHQLALQATKEALHGRIVIPRANTVHAGRHPILL